MPFHTACPHCRTSLQVPSKKQGQQVTCPKCARAFQADAVAQIKAGAWLETRDPSTPDAPSEIDVELVVSSEPLASVADGQRRRSFLVACTIASTAFACGLCLGGTAVAWLLHAHDQTPQVEVAKKDEAAKKDEREEKPKEPAKLAEDKRPRVTYSGFVVGTQTEKGNTILWLSDKLPEQPRVVPGGQMQRALLEAALRSSAIRCVFKGRNTTVTKLALGQRVSVRGEPDGEPRVPALKDAQLVSD